MELVAYCTQPAAESVGRALNIKPLTAPPLTWDTLPPGIFDKADLIYIRLHGMSNGTPYWYGEDMQSELNTALDRDYIEASKIKPKAVVVLANCYGATSPLAQSFYRAGVQAVISGYGPNYAAKNRIVGADLLVRWIERGLRQGLTPRGALKMGKARLAISAWRFSDRDAMKFNIIDNQVN